MWSWLFSSVSYFETFNCKDTQLSRTKRRPIKGFLLSSFWFSKTVPTTLYSLENIIRLKSSSWLGWVLVWRFWGKFPFKTHSSCLSNVVSCPCKTEVIVSLLTVSQDLFQVLRVTCIPCHQGLSIFKPVMLSWILLVLQISVNLSCHQLEKNLCFWKAYVVRFGLLT